MENIKELLGQFSYDFTDEMVKSEVEKILKQHTSENDNVEVYKQCLNQIDLTTLSGDDTVKRVATMAQRVNEFKNSFPHLPNVAAICVYPAMVPVVKEYLKENNVAVRL